VGGYARFGSDCRLLGNYPARSDEHATDHEPQRVLSNNRIADRRIASGYAVTQALICSLISYTDLRQLNGSLADKLGLSEIAMRIGEGGMGEVWKAHEARRCDQSLGGAVHRTILSGKPSHRGAEVRSADLRCSRWAHKKGLTRRDWQSKRRALAMNERDPQRVNPSGDRDRLNHLVLSGANQGNGIR
jgi:hypothetical protein